MSSFSPPPLNSVDESQRLRRITQVARSFGFIGSIEYCHVYSQTGGAQYGRGSSSIRDLLIVYAEAFERDKDPEDFSLEAILAHERGHQLLARHPRIVKYIAKPLSLASEEILASLLGAMISKEQTDRDALLAKATVELVEHGEDLPHAVERLQELWDLMESLL